MPPITLPISPSLDNQGRLVALVPLLGAANATPVALPPLDGTWDVQLSVATERTTAFAKLGVSAVFSSTGSGETTTMVWDALIGKNAVGSNPSAVIFSTFWGVGLRIGLTYKAVDILANVDAAVVAAESEFHSRDVQYEIHAIGLGPKQLATVLRTIPPLGKFDMTSYALLDGLRQTLKSALLDELQTDQATRDRLQPLMVGLSASPFVDDLDDAACYRFVMLQIASGHSLAATLQNAGPWKRISIERVKQLFTELAGGTGVPSDGAKQDASDWLNVG
jgi:hypothetical protein